MGPSIQQDNGAIVPDQQCPLARRHRIAARSRQETLGQNRLPSNKGRAGRCTLESLIDVHCNLISDHKNHIKIPKRNVW